MSASAVHLDQSIFVVPSFTLECGRVLKNVPVAYKTWGALNDTRDNVMIICHAFTGSADVEDWWGPLMGRGKAFDPLRFFIFCANVLGSPYGSASPITANPDTGKPYGPEFPATTIRDDVWIHKRVLDHLGVKSVAVAIGGSMGGMAVLEWPLCTPNGYIRHIIPIATSARHSAWCISWGEAQRQSIYSDPGYEDGFYITQPASGLSAARMSALLTYRSRDSFESRFGRKAQVQADAARENTPPPSPQLTHAEHAVEAHNDGHRNARPRSPTVPRPPVFSAQSYLRYQGQKFTARFDANCYIHITRKMDTHDVARNRDDGNGDGDGTDNADALARVLATLPPRALVISVASDGLFTPSEQRELAAHIPGAELAVIQSPDGHDGFLLEFAQINGHVLRFLRHELPELYVDGDDDGVETELGGQKTSVFGEAEVDVVNW
ncbi:Alpha/Beta hydrolase protein [Mycena maculata]|uniref:Alpha/Beta hydrolase protein n=1 Tax=Mycena maculata TaxID=230809 RepID=A0AAD7N630_9AGAR|nr:Alpha/Beta hydrolase protein [Mycena maculata]KAJ7776023.1 Alpha/Beta hydrolase protein [Mycena maculata]